MSAISSPLKAAVIGHPVAHSKSPLIHAYWLMQHDLAGHYRTIDIAPDALADGVRELVEDGYDGFNVTVPHKVAIMNLCADLDDTARAIGAVNTVVIQDGKLYGKNTDAFGFIENLKQAQPCILFDKPAMVLGAGGAARAVIYGLLQEGVPRIHLTNRSVNKAEQLAAMDPARIDVVPWDRRHELNDISLLINTTSLGMAGQPALEINLTALPRGAVVYDIVYAPLMTDLLSAAQMRGNPIVTGIGMLLHQARAAFHVWTGVMPEVDAALEKKVLA